MNNGPITRDLPTRSAEIVQAEAYTYRVPTPPRIIVPPPLTEPTDLPEWAPVPIRGPAHWPSEATNFLKEVDLNQIISTGVIMEWSYEKRRKAQQILPFLYLGPLYAAKDQAFLKHESITMLLVIRSGVGMVGALKAADQLGLAKATVDIKKNEDLITSFPRAVRLINEHISHTRGHGKVLATCESGNERSAAVVAAYLMEMFQNVDHITAMQLCQARRFCVNFEDALKLLLRSYNDILDARRAVNGFSYTFSGTSPHENGHSGHKRRVDEMRDEEMEVDDADENMDAARFDRDAYAPFHDA